MRFQFFYAVVATLLLISGSGYADDIRVARASFAGGIVGHEPSPVIAGRNGVAPGPIWFHLEIHGGPDALRRLRQTKSLDLRLAWYQVFGLSVEPGQGTDFERSFETLDDAKIAKLEREVRAQGHFTYRSWFCRSRTPVGRKWIVEVIDGSGQRVSCTSGGACQFGINITPAGLGTVAPCRSGAGR